MSIARKVLDLLTRRERRQAYLLVPLVVLMALAEIAGIASVVPFLSLMSDPASAQTNPVLSYAYRTFGFESDRSFLIAVGLAVIAALLSANIVLMAGYWVLYRFGSLRNYSISRRLLTRYLQQPYAFFLMNNSSALANNILVEVQQIVNGVVVPGLQVIAKGVAALAIVIMLVAIDPFLAATVTVLLGGAFGAMYAGTRAYLGRIGKDRVRANQARFQAANEAMGGIKDLRLLAREGEMVRRYSRPAFDFARYQANSRIIETLPRYGLEAIAFGSIVAIVLVMLSADAGIGTMLPVLGLYAFAGYRLLPALQQVFSGATQIRYSSAALDEVHAMVHDVGVRQADPDTFRDAEGIEPLPFRDRLRMENVRFEYPGSDRVIHDVSLEIPAQSSVAFVGTTGAGKTTIVDLLLGLLDPTGGRILVDGVPLDEETLPRWQKQIGYVPQSIFLTDDTIAHNIAFGLPEERVDMDAVEHAARLAQIDDFIARELPDGYATVVGERGVRLSGGQRQRLGIARALYHDPDVLVFDEATSALDGATERAVYGAIAHLARTKTIVTIAHRLTTIENADRVFLLDHGRLVAEGTFEEVYRSSGAFRRMADRAEEAPAPTPTREA